MLTTHTHTHTEAGILCLFASVHLTRDICFCHLSPPAFKSLCAAQVSVADFHQPATKQTR